MRAVDCPLHTGAFRPYCAQPDHVLFLVPRCVAPLVTQAGLPCRYNQFAFNTLSRVTPVSHGVCNVVKRVCIIGASVLFFGNKLTDQTKLGTAIALVGTYLYTEASKKYGKGALPKPEFPRHSCLSGLSASN